MTSVFPLSDHYAYLAEDGTCLSLPITETFWSEDIERLPDGRLISHFTFEDDWASWEMHPDGDEWVLQLSGAMTLVFDPDSGLEPRHLEAGQFTIVPAGAWHTGDVSVPGQALFITVGSGTQTRPR